MNYFIATVTVILSMALCFISFKYISKINLKIKSKKLKSSEPQRTEIENATDTATVAINDSLDISPKKWQIATFFVFSLLMGAMCLFKLLCKTQQIVFLETMVCAAGLLSAAVVDIKTKKIPNAVVLFLLVSRVVFFVFEFIFLRDEFVSILKTSSFGFIVSFVVLFVLSTLTRGGFGMGDVKIVSAVAFLFGIIPAMYTVLAGLILCMFFAIAELLLQKKNKKDKIAFGPFIFLGYILIEFFIV